MTSEVIEIDPTTLDPKRWKALGVIAIAQLMVVLDASIVNLALPSAKRALHISNANQQWVITAYTLAFGGLLLLGGRIASIENFAQHRLLMADKGITRQARCAPKRPWVSHRHLGLRGHPSRCRA